jgi:glycyl-tRNA synthetase beta chain
MVGEFPELQGVMGAYYALADGAPAEVASAIREHYLPRGAGDALPVTLAGMSVAIADKLDTLAGIFAIGQKPSGTRDPFGLRRAAIGVLRIVLEKHLDLDLATLIASAVAAQPVVADVTADVHAYVMERLRAQYLESAAGISTEMFDAVLATAPRSVPDFDARLQALRQFLARAEAGSLTAANKRIANILRKSAGGLQTAVDAALLQPGAEQQLQLAVAGLRPGVEAALAARDYASALDQLSRLRPVVDAFFDTVLVNDPDERLRHNRLALLAELRALFARIADLSLLPG